MKGAPRKAVILAAGFGARLLPLTAALPKPLLPLWGRPLLGHSLLLLRRWGVRDVLVNLHYGAGAVAGYVRGAAATLGLRATLSFEPELLGTGGALRRAAWFLDTEPFWMLNADVAADLSPRPLVAEYRRTRPLAVLWLHPTAGPRTVETEKNRILDFRSRRAGTAGTYTFCGLQLLSPDILAYLPLCGCAAIVEAYEAALRAGRPVLGVCVPDAYWADAGTPEAYRTAHTEVCDRYARDHRAMGARLYDPRQEQVVANLRRRGVRIEGFAAVDPAAQVAPGACLADTVLLAGSRVGSHSRLCRTVVAPDTRVRGQVEDAMVMRADRFLDPDLPAILVRLGWRPERTTVIPLGARGSARVFLRLQSGSRQAIMIRYSLERAENALYAGHARLLAAAGVPVPRVLFDWPEHQVTIIEDLGHRPLLSLVAGRGPAAVERLYRLTLDVALRLHAHGTRLARRRAVRLMPAFGPSLYRWERTLFAERFLRDWLRYQPADYAAALAELAGVARELDRQPQVLIHRDLQSSNVFFHRGRPCLIDFQGMRFGAALYDLAALLCDPYVQLELGLQRRLLDYYRARGGAAFTPGDFWRAALQRLAQALGAYGRLAAEPAMADFARHMGPAVAMMRRALAQLDGFPALRRLLDDAAGRLAGTP